MTNYTTPVNEPGNGISIVDRNGVLSYHANTGSTAVPSKFQSYTDTNPSGIADAAAGQAMGSASDENAESRAMGSDTGEPGAAPESSSASGTGITVAYGFIKCGNGYAREDTALDGYQISCLEDGKSSSGQRQVSVSACSTDNGADCGNLPKEMTAAAATNAPASGVGYTNGWSAASVPLVPGSTYGLPDSGKLILGDCVPYAVHTCVGKQCNGVTYVNDLGVTRTCGPTSSNPYCQTQELPNPAYPVGNFVTCAAEIRQSDTFSSRNFYNLSNRGQTAEEKGLYNGNSYISDTVGAGVVDNQGTQIFQGTTSASAKLATDILNNDGIQTCTDNQVSQMTGGQGYAVTCNGQSDVPVSGFGSTSCSTGYTCNKFTTTTTKTKVSCNETVGDSQAYSDIVDPVRHCTSVNKMTNCGYGSCTSIDSIPETYDRKETWQCPTCKPYYTYLDTVTWSLNAPQVCNSYAWSGTNQMVVSTSTTADPNYYRAALDYSPNSNTFSGYTNISGTEAVGCTSSGNSGVMGTGDEICPDSHPLGANSAAVGSCITLNQKTGNWSGGPITVESEPKTSAYGGYVQQNMVFTPEGQDIHITDSQTTATCTRHKNCTTKKVPTTTCKEEEVQTGQSCTTTQQCTTKKVCHKVSAGFSCVWETGPWRLYEIHCGVVGVTGNYAVGVSTVGPNFCPSNATPYCFYGFGSNVGERHQVLSTPLYKNVCHTVKTCHPVKTCTPVYTEEKVCTTTYHEVTTCNPYTSCVTSSDNFGQIGQITARVKSTKHYACTDSPGNPVQSKDYTYSTCRGYTSVTRQIGSLGATPSSPGEAESGDYGKTITNLCIGYTDSAAGPPKPACPDTGVPYNVKQSAKFAVAYENFVKCSGEATGNWGCAVSADAANAPSSCPPPMSTTDNTSPVSGCGFGSLQDANAAGGDYYGTCSGANDPNHAFARDLLADSACSVAKSVCPVIQDGHCINPWTFYACYGAVSACPNT